MKYIYNGAVYHNGELYIPYKGCYYHWASVKRYEDCNNSPEETLKDMWSDTMDNPVYFEKVDGKYFEVFVEEERTWK